MSRGHTVRRTALAGALVVGQTLVLGPAVTALGLLTLRRWHRTDVLAKTWARNCLKACGATLGVRGLEHVDPRRHYVMVSNHQSHLDAPAILATVPQKVRFVAKRSLFYIPVFGAAIWAAGNIPVNRKAKGSAKKQLDDVRRVVGKELSVLFFAEGTRSDDGVLLPFKKGAAAMAIDGGVDVLPLAVAGTREVLPKGFSWIHPGPIGLAFGPPIPVAPFGGDRDALTAKLRAEVERLMGEAEAARADAASSRR